MAAPKGVTAEGVPVQAAPMPASTAPPQYIHPWRGEQLCGCFEDLCICLSVWCCPWITLAQLYERVIGPKGTCQKVAAVLATFLALGYIFHAIGTATTVTTYYTEGGHTVMRITEKTRVVTIWSLLANTMQLCFAMCAFAIVMIVRQKLRNQQGCASARMLNRGGAHVFGVALCLCSPRVAWRLAVVTQSPTAGLEL